MKRMVVVVAWTMAATMSLVCWPEASANPVSGDLRYRHEMIDREGSDVRNRHRVRARIGMSGEVNENLTIHARLATGSSDPVSTNQTLDGAFGSKGIYFDRAYLDWKTAGSSLRILAGKMKNPFFRPGKSQLFWDSDLNPEGLALQTATSLDATAVLFANAGGFWVDERSSGDDSILISGQVGVRTARLTAGVGYFSYSETQGKSFFFDPGDCCGNSSADGTTYEFGYREIQGFFEVSLPAGPLPLLVYGDYAKNTDPSHNNTAYLAGFKYGKAKKPGSWEIIYNYRKVEKDAVLGAFCDSDFCGGGTDGKGHVFGLGIAAAKNTAFVATYFHNTAHLDSEQGYQRLQVDFKAKI